MPIALEKFVQQLQDSGILAGDTLKDFIPPKASPKDAEELARELVRKKKLTRFQAEEVSKGKGKSLVLGNYVLMEKIGAGGMGQVFKAEHRRMHRMVAIKMLPSNVTKDAAAIARFEREVTAAAKLRHPNIVAADDADCANGIHFLVMELVEGQDLSALVKKHGTFSIGDALDYVIQAAKGLEFAHKKGVVHRDIKPANLLLDKEGVVKILDMGLARLGGDGDGTPQADLTSTGTIMGTVDYMAPEQALDTKTADARADIYALGCSLYFLLTGKSTYDGDTLMKKLLAHREQPIPALRTIRPEVSEQLEAVFKKLVAKKVEDRYQSMTDVIVELERCTAGSTSSATIQQPPTTTFNNSAFDFLKRLPDEPTILAKPEANATASTTGNNKKLPLIAAAVLGLALLAGIIVSLGTKDGTLVVEIDQPDALVQVLDVEGKVEISQKGGKGLVSISVDPGKHRLKVEKDGFAVFGREFEMKSGGRTPIKAKLIPLGLKPAVAGLNKPLFFQTPEFEPWAKQVAAMPAEQQVKAVSKKLVELNPGFDGKITALDGSPHAQIEDGVVIGIGFHPMEVTDISPVRALAGLKLLNCGCAGPAKGKLTDLSPLASLNLSALAFPSTSVFNLSPLRAMPLAVLNCDGSDVSDLSPLEASQGLRDLWLTDTKVTDLKPLSKLKLNKLSIQGTQVSDLVPVGGIQLEELDFRQTPVTDVSALKDMTLKSIWVDFKPERDAQIFRSIKTLEVINRTPVADFWKKVDEAQKGRKLFFQTPEFEPWAKDVQAMPAGHQVEAVSKKLVELNPGFDGKVTPTIERGVVTGLQFLAEDVTDISPVRALSKLKTLECPGSTPTEKGILSDLSPLSGMQLAVLKFYFTAVSDLSPLKGMRLTNLNAGNTRITDLSPLEGMPLWELLCQSTDVTDLSPLKDLPLKTLWVNDTPVSDLSPLREMNLINLVMTPENILKGIDVIREMKTLAKIGSSWENKDLISPADFWKKYDAGGFGRNKPLAYMTPGFNQWVKEVAAMPAENQVETVSKKLQELNPRFDGKVTNWDRQGSPTIENGIVTQIEIITDNVMDVSPVRALVGLRVLVCKGSGPDKGRLPDLTPITDLPLKHLYLDLRTERDSELLRSIKTLETINYKPVAEFWKEVEEAQKGRKFFFQTPDFDPWAKEVVAMPAEKQVETVSKKLVELNPGFDGNLKNDAFGTPKIESGVVTGLHIFSDHVKDFSPVRALGGLTLLGCGGKGFADLSPLQGMSLTVFAYEGSGVKDLQALRGLPLKRLYLRAPEISDLSPLTGMHLEDVGLNDCHRISNLLPLKGMKLNLLLCSKTQVSDFSPVKDMPLREINLDFKPERDTDFLRSIKTLELINGKPAAEFWKEVGE